MKHNPRSGLTLIEILIAVSLLSLLSIGVLWSMRIGFNTMDKTDNRLVMNRRVSNSRKIVENELNAFMGAFAALHPKPDETRYIPFLQLEPDIMRFVSAYSLEDGWRGHPQIVTMHVIGGDSGAGVRLVMEETPYTGPEQAGRYITGLNFDQKTGYTKVFYIPAQAGAQSFVLADKLAYCKFSYQDRFSVPPFQAWGTTWIDIMKNPKAVRIEMAPLDPNSPDLHVASISIALPVTRTAGRYFLEQ